MSGQCITCVVAGRRFWSLSSSVCSTTLRCVTKRASHSQHTHTHTQRCVLTYQNNTVANHEAKRPQAAKRPQFDGKVLGRDYEC